MDRAIQEQQRLGIQVVRIKRDAGRHLKCAFPLCDEFPRRGSPGILLGVLPQLLRPRMTEVGTVLSPPQNGGARDRAAIQSQNSATDGGCRNPRVSAVENAVLWTVDQVVERI